MHKFSTASTKSSVVLCAPTARPASAGAPDPQAGAPGLLNVPYSTFAGASVARGATHSGRPFRRFVMSRCEKYGLALTGLIFLFQFKGKPGFPEANKSRRAWFLLARVQ